MLKVNSMAEFDAEFGVEKILLQNLAWKLAFDALLRARIKLFSVNNIPRRLFLYLCYTGCRRSANAESVFLGIVKILFGNL